MILTRTSKTLGDTVILLEKFAVADERDARLGMPLLVRTTPEQLQIALREVL